MPRPYALNIPSPRTVIATLLRPLLERLVLWYLRDIAAQQSEVNAEVIRRITSLESDLRQDFQILADQVASLADLVGSCLVVLSRDSHSSSTISIVDNMKDQGSPTKEQ
jgi:hypothetical protein